MPDALTFLDAERQTKKGKWTRTPLDAFGKRPKYARRQTYTPLPSKDPIVCHNSVNASTFLVKIYQAC